jgi:hypothetical protein
MGMLLSIFLDMKDDLLPDPVWLSGHVGMLYDQLIMSCRTRSYLHSTRMESGHASVWTKVCPTYMYSTSRTRHNLCDCILVGFGL